MAIVATNMNVDSVRASLDVLEVISMAVKNPKDFQKLVDQLSNAFVLTEELVQAKADAEETIRMAKKAEATIVAERESLDILKRDTMVELLSKKEALEKDALQAKEEQDGIYKNIEIQKSNLLDAEQALQEKITSVREYENSIKSKATLLEASVKEFEKTQRDVAKASTALATREENVSAREVTVQAREDKLRALLG